MSSISAISALLTISFKLETVLNAQEPTPTSPVSPVRLIIMSIALENASKETAYATASINRQASAWLASTVLPQSMESAVTLVSSIRPTDASLKAALPTSPPTQTTRTATKTTGRQIAN